MKEKSSKAQEISNEIGIPGLMKQYEFDNGGFYNELNKQQELIKLQDKIIKEYEDTLKFLNKVCFDCVKYERNLREEKSDKHNAELMNFVWETNDHIAGTFECLEDDLKKLKELRGE